MYTYLIGVYVIDPDGNMHNLVLVAYKYDKIVQQTLLINPHGNSKKKQPYHRVMDSTKAKLSRALATVRMQLTLFLKKMRIAKC